MRIYFIFGQIKYAWTNLISLLNEKKKHITYFIIQISIQFWKLFCKNIKTGKRPKWIDDGTHSVNFREKHSNVTSGL